LTFRERTYPGSGQTTFGKMQGRKVLDGRPDTHGNRYECRFPECEELFMSDEALQLHRLHHDLIAVCARLVDLTDSLNKRA